MKIKLIFLILLSCFISSSCKSNQSKNVSENKPLVISWMTSWTPVAQIILSQINTNIPELYQLNCSYKNFIFGPEMNEAAYAGQVDVTNTGVVPTASLLAASDDWIIVGRLIDFSDSIMVGMNSGIKTIADLRGKKVGVPFGGGSHPYLIQRLSEAKLSYQGASPDVFLINIKPPEIPLALEQKSVDAIAAWDPATAIVEIRKLGVTIDEDNFVSFITVRKSLALKDPQNVINLLKAYLEANLFYAQHRELGDQWFAKHSHIEPEIVKRGKIIEKNFLAKTLEEVDINIDSNRLERAQKVVEIMYQNKLITKQVILKNHLDLSYLRQALEQLKTEGAKTNLVSIK